MTLKQLGQIRRAWLDKNAPYQMTYWREYDFSILQNIICIKRAGRGSNYSYNDCFIGCDTETSCKPVSDENHVCAWTISIRAFGRNIVTLWGHRPSSMVTAIRQCMDNMQGDKTICYFHNMTYDWVFLRKFLFEQLGHPKKQLNTKPHYPILIEFADGLILKDSYILSQKSLERWADDLDVEHKKAVGFWDYDKIRNQSDDSTDLSADELKYIEQDTLALVECLDATKISLNKKIYSMPYTATGIPRNDIRDIGERHNAHDAYERQSMDFDTYKIATYCYHGGFTHADRHLVEESITGEIICKDFVSSYPFVLITSNQMPISMFTDIEDVTLDDIIKNRFKYAFMFRLCLIKPRLKKTLFGMPYLQHSKCTRTINNINDNGRIIKAELAEIYINEFDLMILMDQYEWEDAWIADCRYANKGYLPRWFTDYCYKQFEAKCQLKGIEEKKVDYALAKGKLNSLYGMCVQKNVQNEILENYGTGEYEEKPVDEETEYYKYINRRTTILPYQWGVWVTSIATYRLFELGKCVDYENGGDWIYSDTDSCYATKWNEERLNALNEEAKQALLDNNYEPVKANGKEFWLGIAETDGLYSEFRTCGAKRYACRDKESGKLKITVSGVPKKGAECLKDNIDNFTKGTIFSGEVTGKLTHTHIFKDTIYTDADGNETGDSIHLSPCDYLLDSIFAMSFDDLFVDDLEVQIYDPAMARFV